MKHFFIKNISLLTLMMGGSLLQTTQAQTLHPLETTCKDSIYGLGAGGLLITAEIYHPSCSGTTKNAWQRKVLESGDKICLYSKSWIDNDSYKSLWEAIQESFELTPTGWSADCPTVLENGIPVPNVVTANAKVPVIDMSRVPLKIPYGYMKISNIPWQVALPDNNEEFMCPGQVPPGYLVKPLERYLQGCSSQAAQIIYFNGASLIFIPNDHETATNDLKYFPYINTHIVTNKKEQYYLTGQQYDSASQQWKNIYSQTTFYTIKRPVETYETVCKYINTANPTGYRVVGEHFVAGCDGSHVPSAPNALLLKKIQDEVEIICIKSNSTNNLYLGQTIPDSYSNVTSVYKSECPAVSGSSANAWQMIRK